MILSHLANGEIIHAVRDDDMPIFQHTIQEPVRLFEIDEMASNKDLIIDLIRTMGRVNTDGVGKYYIQDSTLFVRDGWQEAN